VDIFGTVFKLRKQRTNMVQTEVSVSLWIVWYSWWSNLMREIHLNKNKNKAFKLMTLGCMNTGAMLEIL
jgi:hypothetical protein